MLRSQSLISGISESAGQRSPSWSASSSSGAQRRGTAVAEPMVVVDDLHIVYKVYGAGGDRGASAAVLLRALGRKTRGNIREVRAIRGISFIAYRGEAIGIIGRNGS